jgi:hypothetical protein
LLRHISSFSFRSFGFLEVVDGRENVMMDLLEVALPENPRSWAPPGPNLDDLLGFKRAH